MDELGGLIMKVEELEKLCLESEIFAQETGWTTIPSFNVTLRAKRECQTVRLAPGLSGENLGCFEQNGVWYTQVNLSCEKVRKFLSKIKEQV